MLSGILGAFKNSTAATSSEASINQTTGVATFALLSGTTLTDALLDITARFTTATDAAGEMALFRINNAGSFYLFVSDGVGGVTAGDTVVQLANVTTVGSISITGGDLFILT